MDDASREDRSLPLPSARRAADRGRSHVSRGYTTAPIASVTSGHPFLITEQLNLDSPPETGQGAIPYNQRPSGVGVRTGDLPATFRHPTITRNMCGLLVFVWMAAMAPAYASWVCRLGLWYSGGGSMVTSPVYGLNRVTPAWHDARA